jgi:hypothetical protein
VLKTSSYYGSRKRELKGNLDTPLKSLLECLRERYDVGHICRDVTLSMLDTNNHLVVSPYVDRSVLVYLPLRAAVPGQVFWAGMPARMAHYGLPA